MEAGTAEQAAAGSTVEHDPRPATAPAPAGSTIADLLPRAVASFPEHVAIRHKQDGAWLDVTYAGLGEIVREIALGLIDLGIQPGERVCILAGTRPEWTYADLAITAAGAVVVPIYPTNSPEECHWVISDSGACAIVCENAEQLAKVAAVRDRLPELRTVIVVDPDGSPEAIPLAEVRARGRARGNADGDGAGDAGELERRRAALTPEDPYTFIYTSGTTGPPKGCVLSHGNYCSVVDMVREIGQIHEGEIAYLFLPLAHAFALLIQLGAIDRGTTIAYFGGDVKQIVGELQEVKPTFLPSVPRIFEKIYTLAHGAIEAQPPEERARTEAAIELGSACATCSPARKRFPRSCARPSRRPRRACSKTCVRSSAGACARPPPAPPRSRTRSSSSSGPAAYPCWRGTG